MATKAWKENPQKAPIVRVLTREANGCDGSTALPELETPLPALNSIQLVQSREAKWFRLLYNTLETPTLKGSL